MLKGDFYSSSGVMLEKLVRGESHIELSVNKDETACELESEFLFGRPVRKGKPGTFIEFIGPGGEIAKSDRRNIRFLRGGWKLSASQGNAPR